MASVDNALEVYFQDGKIQPDDATWEHIRADYSRLRKIIELVHSVEEADELDGTLLFRVNDAARRG